MTRPRHRRPRIEVRLLGPPQVVVDGAPLAVDTRKAVAILAMLAAEERDFARDEVAAILWPESDDAAARGALRRTLSTLRSALGDGPLITDRTRVELDARETWVDLWVVRAAEQTSDRARLEAAAALVRGEFLAGFNLRDSPEFDDWKAIRAVIVERSVLTVFDRLASVAEADGDLAVAIDAASRRLEIDPLDESAHVRLMDLLDASGDRSGALRQFRNCVATLERELGVAPLASTIARYEAIRDRVPVDPVGVPARLVTHGSLGVEAAPRAYPLVGREAEVASLVATLERAMRGEGRTVAIVGEAGIGKTRLGAELAGIVRSRGGVVLATTAHPAERGIAYGSIVDLLRIGRVSEVDTGSNAIDAATRNELSRLIPGLVSGSSGGSAPDGPGAQARLVGAIADGLRALVVGPTPGLVWIDDVQWLDTSSRLAIGSLVRRPGDQPLIVALSWRPSDLDTSGRTFADQILADASTTRIELERLKRAAVLELVAAAGVDAYADPLDVDRLVLAAEGLPLYVVEALAVGSDESPGSLPRGVRTVLVERLGSIDEATMRILSAASVIGRTFDLATLRHASGRSEDETIDGIDVGIQRGLIRETPSGFDFVHAALRDVAYESMTLTRRRLLHRRVAAAMRLDLAGIGRGDLARLVMLASHEHAAGRDAEAADAYRHAGARAAAVFANDDAIAHLTAALALGYQDRAPIHAEIGRLRTRTGDYAGAVAALDAAAALADPDALPELEWLLGRAHFRRGDLAASMHHLDAALAGSADVITTARILVDRCAVLRRTGDRAGAAATARAAAEAARRSGDVSVIGASHRMLGLVASDAGDLGAARTELLMALDASVVDPDPTARIAALASLALASASTGAVPAAVDFANDAIDACRRIGDRHLEAAVEDHLADILHAAGHDDEAKLHQLRAVEAFAEVDGDPADPDPGIWMLSAS